MNKGLVIFSGGLDSTVAIAEAIHMFGKENVEAISFAYGQKHQAKELKAAKRIAKTIYDIPHTIMDISIIFAGLQSELLGDQNITKESYEVQLAKKSGGVVDTYVPFRNGIMIAMATAKAFDMVNGTDDHCGVYIGAHADDAAGNAYPDCSLEFLKYINKAVYVGTDSNVSIISPFATMSKAAIVKLGYRHIAPMEVSWSCYDGGKIHCGICGTCIDRKKAFKEANVVDKTEYKK